jgi:hypothetical protein
MSIPDNYFHRPINPRNNYEPYLLNHYVDSTTIYQLFSIKCIHFRGFLCNYGLVTHRYNLHRHHSIRHLCQKPCFFNFFILMQNLIYY